jgi:hypothetical protein
MPVNSRQKGKRLEREAARSWSLAIGSGARRSVQYSGDNGDADLRVDVEGLHVEVKGRKSIGALRFYEQAEEDAAKTASIPLVLLREDGDTDWYCLVRLNDMRTVAGKIAVIGERP